MHNQQMTLPMNEEVMIARDVSHLTGVQGVKSTFVDDQQSDCRTENGLLNEISGKK